MVWTINYSQKAFKSLKKMDKTQAKRILDFLEKRISFLDEPRILGKPLKGDLGEFWRYRVGDYRMICEIQDKKLIILAVLIDHRKSIY